MMQVKKDGHEAVHGHGFGSALSKGDAGAGTRLLRLLMKHQVESKDLRRSCHEIIIMQLAFI